MKPTRKRLESDARSPHDRPNTKWLKLTQGDRQHQPYDANGNQRFVFGGVQPLDQMIGEGKNYDRSREDADVPGSEIAHGATKWRHTQANGDSGQVSFFGEGGEENAGQKGSENEEDDPGCCARRNGNKAAQ